MNRTQERFRFYLRLIAACAIGLSVVVIPCAVWLVLFARSMNEPFRPKIVDPRREFEQCTHLQLPHEAKCVIAKDTRGGINGDGDFYFVFEVKKEAIAQWKALAPRVGETGWIEGGVPSHIAFRIPLPTVAHELESPDTVYAYEDRSPYKYLKRCTRGEAVAVNERLGRVYYWWWRS